MGVAVVDVVDDAFATVQAGLLMALQLRFSCARAAVHEKTVPSYAVRPLVPLGWAVSGVEREVERACVLKLSEGPVRAICATMMRVVVYWMKGRIWCCYVLVWMWKMLKSLMHLMQVLKEVVLRTLMMTIEIMSLMKMMMMMINIDCTWPVLSQRHRRLPQLLSLSVQACQIHPTKSSPQRPVNMGGYLVNVRHVVIHAQDNNNNSGKHSVIEKVTDKPTVVYQYHIQCTKCTIIYVRY